MVASENEQLMVKEFHFRFEFRSMIATFGSNHMKRHLQYVCGQMKPLFTLVPKGLKRAVRSSAPLVGARERHSQFPPVKKRKLPIGKPEMVS